MCVCVWECTVTKRTHACLFSFSPTLRASCCQLPFGFSATTRWAGSDGIRTLELNHYCERQRRGSRCTCPAHHARLQTTCQRQQICERTRASHSLPHVLVSSRILGWREMAHKPRNAGWDDTRLPASCWDALPNVECVKWDAPPFYFLSCRFIFT